MTRSVIGRPVENLWMGDDAPDFTSERETRPLSREDAASLRGHCAVQNRLGEGGAVGGFGDSSPWMVVKAGGLVVAPHKFVIFGRERRRQIRSSFDFQIWSYTNTKPFVQPLSIT